MNTHRSSRSGRSTLVGLASVVVLLAACGGGDGAGEPSATDSAASEQTSAPASTDAPDATLAPAATDAGGSDAGGSDDGDGSGTLELPDMTGLPEECQRLAEALSGAFGGMENMSPTDTQFDMFGPMAEAMRKLKGSLPSEFDADLDTMAEAFGALDEVLAGYDYDLMQAMTDPAAMQALEALDDESVQQASDRLGAYFDETCSVEP